MKKLGLIFIFLTVLVLCTPVFSKSYPTVPGQDPLYTKAIIDITSAINMHNILEGQNAYNYQNTKLFYLLKLRMNITGAQFPVLYTVAGSKLTVKNGNGCIAVNNPQNRYCSIVDVDVNGDKGPNKYGSDIFKIGIYPDKAVAID